MAFEDYRPGDRRISGQGHIASWLILAVLAGILVVTAPVASSSSADSHIAAVAEDDCAV
jgi:hypothetical protein